MNGRSQEKKRSPREGNKEVVLVADTHISPRMCKIGWALRSCGFHTVLLHHRNGHKYLQDTAQFFDRTHAFGDPGEAVELARAFDPLAYHVFSSWNFDLAELLIRAGIGKVVFDDSDIISGIVKQEFADKNYPNLMARERFCLENADGVVARSRELQHARRKLRLNMKGKTILFLDYCWNYPLPEDTRRGGDELHLVYAGSVFARKFFPSGTKNETFPLYPFAREIAAAKIHFHIYPNPSVPSCGFDDYYDEYLRLSEETPYFHMHRPVPSNQLGPELSRYDLALVTAVREDVQSGNEAYHQFKNQLSMPHKIFDCLDAGLGIIVAEAFGLAWSFVKRTGTGTDAYLEEVTGKLIARPMEQWLTLKENARAARSTYAVKAQIPRLISFYFSLHDGARKGTHLAQAYALFRDGDLPGSMRQAEQELRLYPGSEDARRFMKTLRVTALKS